MEVGQTYKLEIESYDINGYGVSHIDSKVIFVEKALIGETVIARLTSVHKKYAFAVTERVLKETPNRINPKCPYYALCGGCDLLHLTYKEECIIKENKVKQTLRRKDNIIFNPIISSNQINGYRNKVMVPFTRDDEDDVLYGFYEKSSHKIVSMDNCIISSDLANKILYFINRYLNIFHVSIYNEELHEGVFKEVMIRNTSLNEYMIVLVVTKEIDFSQLIHYLTNEFNEIKSIYLNINEIKTNVVLSQNYKLLYGNPVIIEDILGLKFQVSPSSFMQVNHNQCEALYAEALRMANITKNMNVIDAYCGMGSITLNIAKNANKVYGIEIVEQAIKNANENKILNNISNVEFICGKCEDEITKLVNKEKIDVIVFDPPRKGCDSKFLDTVIKMAIPKIVYISCNIATVKRDIDILEANGYELKEVTPVDLFPRTAHVECIALLNRKDQ